MDILVILQLEWLAINGRYPDKCSLTSRLPRSQAALGLSAALVQQFGIASWNISET